MTGDIGKLAGPCKREFEDLEARRTEFGGADWHATPITNDCKLHIFIEEIHWDGISKPSNAAFAARGLSTRADGGRFPPLSKSELKELMHRTAIQAKKHFVGAVVFPVEGIRHDDELNKLSLEHDPLPWRDDKGVHEQDASHVQIVCKKNTDRRDRFQQLCEWSLHPSEVLASLDE